MGGKPSKGTKKDKRLRENRRRKANIRGLVLRRRRA